MASVPSCFGGTCRRYGWSRRQLCAHTKQPFACSFDQRLVLLLGLINGRNLVWWTLNVVLGFVVCIYRPGLTSPPPGRGAGAFISPPPHCTSSPRSPVYPPAASAPYKSVPTAGYPAVTPPPMSAAADLSHIPVSRNRPPRPNSHHHQHQASHYPPHEAWQQNGSTTTTPHRKHTVSHSQESASIQNGQFKSKSAILLSLLDW